MPLHAADRYLGAHLLPDSLFLRVFTVQERRIDPSWDAADVCSSYWRLYVNNRSGASLQLDGLEYPLTPGRAHFVPPWVRFTCCCRQVVLHRYVHFDLVGLPGVVVREVFPTPDAVAADDGLSRLLKPLASADATTQIGPAGLLRAKAAVSLALARLMEALPADRARRLCEAARPSSPIAAVLAHIETHLARPLPNCELAGVCCLGVDQFIRVFRTQLGQTPAQYVLERRVARAAQLLVFTPLSIKAVALETGFADRYHLTRAFGIRMGMPPAAYRRSRHT